MNPMIEFLKMIMGYHIYFSSNQMDQFIYHGFQFFQLNDRTKRQRPKDNRTAKTRSRAIARTRNKRKQE
jgi:hypothetical protein